MEKTISESDPEAGLFHCSGKPERMHYLDHQSVDGKNGNTGGGNRSVCGCIQPIRCGETQILTDTSNPRNTLRLCFVKVCYIKRVTVKNSRTLNIEAPSVRITGGVRICRKTTQCANIAEKA